MGETTNEVDGPLLPRGFSPRVGVGVQPRRFPISLMLDLQKDAQPVEFLREFGPRMTPEEVIDTYVRALRVGCFGAPLDAVVVSGPQTATLTQNASMVQAVVELPACGPEVIAPLATLAWRSSWFGSQVQSMLIFGGAGESPSFELDRPLPIPMRSYRFAIDNKAPREEEDVSLGDASVRVTFRDPISDTTHSRVKALLDAWSGMLRGGFASLRWPLSFGALDRVTVEGTNEIVAHIKDVCGTAAIWDALLRGLDAIDRNEQPIGTVAIDGTREPFDVAWRAEMSERAAARAVRPAPPPTDPETILRRAPELVSVGLHLTLYFKEPLPTFVPAIEEVLNAYLEHAEPSLRWYADSISGRFKRCTPELLRLSPSLLRDPKRTRKSLYWLCLGGEKHEDLTPWRFHGANRLSEYGWDYLNDLSLTFPIDYWDYSKFVEWVLRLLRHLPVFHGVAGFGVAEQEDGGPPRHLGRYVYQMALRYPCLEIDDPDATAHDCYNAIRTPNWLTMVSDELLDRIGGREIVAHKLRPNVQVHPLPWGLLLQAGNRPMLGDVDAGDDLSNYRKVARVLRPLRTLDHRPFGHRNDLSFGWGGTHAWLRRFDAE